MLTKIVLTVIDSFAWMIRLLRVDYPQFRAIMEIKLTMDDRRPNGAMFSNVDKDSKNVLLGTLGLFAFIGTFIGLVITVTGSPLVALTFVLTFVGVYLFLTIVSEFSSVLLDTADGPILQPRPIDGTTILASRIAHISIYLFLLALSLAAGSLVIGSIKWGIITLPFMFLALIGELVFILFIVQALYSVGMRFIGSERIREVILWFQTLATVMLMSMYIILSRLMDLETVKELTIADRWWVYLVPSSWFAAPVDMITGNIGQTQLILTGMAIVIPLAGMILVFKVFGPRFDRHLESLEIDPAAGSPAVREEVQLPVKKNRLENLLSGHISKKPGERAAFELVWMIASRDRQYKMRTYPMLGLIIFYIAMFFIDTDTSLGETLASMQGSNRHLFILYIISFIAPFCLSNLKFSSKYEAAWVYLALPFEKPGDILLGGFKVVVLRYIAPFFILISSVLLLIWGPVILIDILFAACAGIFIMFLHATILGRRFPFSEEFSVAKSAGKSSGFALLFFIPFGMGLIHAAVKTVFPPALILGTLMFLAIDIGLARAYADTPLRMLTR